MNYLSLITALAGLLVSSLAILQLPRRQGLIGRLRHLAPGADGYSATTGVSSARLRRISSDERARIDAEMPDLIDLMAAALVAEGSLHSALYRVSSRANGHFARELQIFLRRIELGQTFTSELSALCERVPTAGVREFANKISIALSRGTPLADTFSALASTLRSRHLNALLAKSGANETKMLIPLVALVLPTTVIFALYPSLLVLQGTFN